MSSSTRVGLFGAVGGFTAYSHWGVKSDGGGSVDVSSRARRRYIVASQAAMLSAGLPTNPPVVGDVVYRTDVDREYQLVALPYTTAANWQPIETGGVESSYRSTPGVFDPNYGTQECNTNQSITAASVVKGRQYKIIAVANIAVAFDLPILANSPMISGNTWSLNAGDELTFYLTADGTAYDAEVQ